MRKILFLIIILLGCQQKQLPVPEIYIEIDLSEKEQPFHHAWAMFGYDEPNYTYMKHGQKLLSDIAEFSPVPVYVRAHNLLSTGDGTPALKWGSTNVYTEDEIGNPVYDWTLVDKIIDTYIDRSMRPLVEIGFMPKALSSKPEPYQHSWRPGAPYEEIYTGWAYPPKDYEKWAELVYQWVIHSIDRYGKDEVEKWYWELWNEPNIGYWQGTLEEYIKLYDYTADAVKRALPTAIMGGPHTTGPSWDKAEDYLRAFLDHVVNGKNYATGETGSPLDFIAFHAKGFPTLEDSIIQMNMGTQLRDISKGFEIVSSYPKLKNLPIIIGESDPEGCAACSMQDYPANAYRNGTMYSSYTAASFPRKYQLAKHHNINLRGIVTWAFEFEGQPYFNGYRDLATNGVNKPVLNVFRMFSRMEGDIVKVKGDLAYDYLTVRDSSVRGEKRDINAFATHSKNQTTILLWNYHDLNVITPSELVEIKISQVSSENFTLKHYRIDQKNSNSYTKWLELGSPTKPTQEQYEMMIKASELNELAQPDHEYRDGILTIRNHIPGQAVSLFIIDYN